MFVKYIQEIDRRMLMKSDEIQRSLPHRLKDYNRNTDELREKAMKTKNKDDPLNLMNKYLNKQKDKRKDGEIGLKENKIDSFIESLRDKRELKKQKKKLLREIKKKRKRENKKVRYRDNENDSSDDSYYRHKRSKRHKKKRKSGKSRHHRHD